MGSLEGQPRVPISACWNTPSPTNCSRGIAFLCYCCLSQLVPLSGHCRGCSFNADEGIMRMATSAVTAI